MGEETGIPGPRGPQGPRGLEGKEGERGPATPALTEVLRLLARSIDRLRFWTLMAVVPSVVGLLVLVVVLGGELKLNRIAASNHGLQTATAANTADLKGAVAASNSTLQVLQNLTSDQAKATSQANLDQLVKSLEGELDCESRRQQARLPAVSPGTCRNNTPADVYPGILGQPLRPLGG